MEGGNRKLDFHLDENYIIIKFSKKEHVRIDLVPFKNKRRKDIVKKINTSLKKIELAITARVSDKVINLTLDNEIINNYGFDVVACNLAIKNNPDVEKKEIRKFYFNEQKERKLKDKVDNRVAGADYNPGHLGFAIIDVDRITGELDKLLYKNTFDLTWYTNQKNISKKDRKKLLNELAKIITFMINMCIHYRVSYFGIEDLQNIASQLGISKGKNFNRLTKNVWNRLLQTNLIKAKCGENGIIFTEVLAIYTSFIGNIKYEFFDSTCAAIEIARRAYLKYIKIESRLYPQIDKKDYEKMYYLTGHDLSNCKTWVACYKKFKSDSNHSVGGW